MTKPPLSDQIVLAVKDQLRNVRYHIRRSAQDDRARAFERGAPRVPRPVAKAANAVFSQVEAAATAWLPDGDRRSQNFQFPLPVEAYFGGAAAGEDRAGAFTPEIYYALKGLLRRFGAEAFLVSEQAVEDARGRILDRSNADPGLSGERLCAALAVELAATRPIKELAPNPDAGAGPRNLFLSPNAYCALVIGLSIAIVSRATKDEAVDLEVIVGSADMAVDARFAALSAALKSRDPTESLSREFSALLPFLP